MSANDPGVAKYVIMVPPDGSVSTQKLADAAVTTVKVGDGQITGQKIADGTVTADNIAPETLTVDLLDESLLLFTRGQPDRSPVRAAASTDITVVGGAPDTIDGVGLQLGDRVLCIGQTDPVENGIRYVSILGTGANGTWARAADADENGEVFCGIEVTVQEGSVFAGAQYRLSSPGVINLDVDDQVWGAVTGGVSDGDYGDITVSGGGTVFTINSGAVGSAELDDISTDTLLGRDTTGTGAVELISVGGGIEFTGAGALRVGAYTGDVAKASGGTTLTIGTNAVTFAKFVQASAQFKFVARYSESGGNFEEAGFDDTLEFAAGNLQRAHITGDIDVPAGSNVSTLSDTTDLSSTMAGQVMALIMFFGG